jgi:PAS domain S-box-containing protein
VRAIELGPLLDDAATVVAKTLGVEFSALAELQPDGGQLCIRAGVGWKKGELVNAGKPSHFAFALAINEPIIVEDFQTETRFPLLTLGRERKLRSGLAVLIPGSNRPWGILSAHALKPRKFTQDDATFIRAVATIIAQTMERLTSEQTLRHSEEYYRTLIHSSSDTIIVMKPDGTIAFSSDAVRQFGRDQEGYIGTTAMEYVHPDDYEAVHRGQAEALMKGTSQYELRIRSENGEWRICEARVNLACDPDGAPVLVASTRDISEHKRLERDLLEARDAALEVSRLKSEFMANISHEIRTPLNAIVGFTGLLLDTPLNEDQSEMLESVRTSSDALLSLVNDILDFSKLAADRLEFETIDFNPRETVEAAVEMFSGAAQVKGIELTLGVDAEVPAMLNGDPGRLRQVICNLVSNALKFIEQGRISITVGVERNQQDSVTLRVEVKDTGIGIPREAHAMLFEPFTQADASVTRKYGGTGLGLAIAANLVSKMNGHIGVVSEPGTGSMFHFTAQLRKCAPTPAALDDRGACLRTAPAPTRGPQATHPGRRRQRHQPEGGAAAAHQAGLPRRWRRERLRGSPGAGQAALRGHPNGLPDAGNGWLSGHHRDSPDRAGPARPPRGDNRDDGQCDGRRPRKMPRGGNG